MIAGHVVRCGRCGARGALVVSVCGPRMAHSRVRRVSELFCPRGVDCVGEPPPSRVDDYTAECLWRDIRRLAASAPLDLIPHVVCSTLIKDQLWGARHPEYAFIVDAHRPKYSVTLRSSLGQVDGRFT